MNLENLQERQKAFEDAVRKRISFAMPFYSRNAIAFYQDRLRTNIGKALKKREMRFLTGPPPCDAFESLHIPLRLHRAGRPDLQVRKRVLCAVLYYDQFTSGQT